MLRMGAKCLRIEHSRKFAYELKIRANDTRKEFFDTASSRVLAGTADVCGLALFS